MVGLLLTDTEGARPVGRRPYSWGDREDGRSGQRADGAPVPDRPARRSGLHRLPLVLTVTGDSTLIRGAADDRLRCKGAFRVTADDFERGSSIPLRSRCRALPDTVPARSRRPVRRSRIPAWCGARPRPSEVRRRRRTTRRLTARAVARLGCTAWRRRRQGAACRRHTRPA